MKPFPLLLCAIFVLSVIPLASASSVDVRARVLHVKDGPLQVTDKGNGIKVGKILGHVLRKSGSVVLLALGDDCTGTGHSGQLQRRDFDHIGNFNFRVEIEGVTVGAFRNVEGLESETEVIEFQDGEDIILSAPPNSGHEWTVYGKGNDVNVEEIELAVEKIERA